MIDQSAYMLRISQASPVGLVVINFELVVEFLKAADSGDTDSFRAAVSKAKDGLEQLIQALDFDVPASAEFYEIYNYCYKLLSDAHFSSDIDAARAACKEVAEHMETLLEGWRVAEEKSVAETAETAPDEAPKVYTGLTYGRDGSANEYIDENKDRSFMA